jgi:hypothetical protein
MTGTYSRKLSFNERLFVVGADYAPPLANQMIFEGSGAFDARLWESAVRTASEANPDTRMVLRGFLNTCRWVDSGVTPPVIEINGGAWDGRGPAGMTRLEKALPPRTGPTCEVVLIQGNPLRVVFRSHHGVMDGRGTYIWAEDVFRALRGEPCVGSRSSMSDIEVARSFQKELRSPLPTQYQAPTGLAEGEETGSVWHRVQVNGRYHHLMALLALETAKQVWSRGESRILVGIPVDMRPRVPGENIIANMTLAIYVEISRSSTPEDIARDIARQVEEKREGMLSRGDDLTRFIPMWLLRRATSGLINRRHDRGVYSLTGIISNLGRIDLQKYTGGGFTPSATFAIPPANEYVPFFLVLAGHGDTVELMLSLPRRLATRNRLDHMLRKLTAAMR